LVDHDRWQLLGIGIEGCLGEVSGQDRPVSADQARHDVHGVRLASPAVPRLDHVVRVRFRDRPPGGLQFFAQPLGF
jgi:hypothetical protein